MTQKISSVNIETATLASFSGPTIANVSIANSTYVLLDDTAVSNAGGYVVITGSNFQSGAQVLFGSTSACTVTFVDSTQLNVQVPALTAGSYVVYVQNGDGSTAIRLNGITSSPIPVWSTGSTLTQQDSGTPISISLAATSDSNVSYSVANGSSLPSGTTLAANGLFSGTVTIETETTYNFSVNAIDAENQDTSRSFSVTVTVGDQYYYLTTLHLSGEAPANNWLTDASANNFALTVNGDTRPVAFSPYETVWSNLFDGTGDYLTIQNTSLLSFDSGDFTVECWFYANSLSPTNYAALMGFHNGSDTNSWAVYVRSNGVFIYGSNGTLTGAGTVNTAIWYHFAATRSGNTVRVFLNGTQQTSVTVAGSYVDGGLLFRIGEDNTAGNPEFNGYISNLRLVKGNALYTSSFTPPTSPLTAVSGTSLLTCQSNRLIDNSTNNFTLTKNGDVTVTTFGPFTETDLVTGSAYFDGNDTLTTPSNSAFTYGTSDFTVEGWFYFTGGVGPSGYSYIFAQGANTGATSLGAYIQSGVFRVWNGSAVISSTASFVQNIWTHIAVTRSGTSMRLFVNGNLEGTVTNSSNITTGTTTGISIGRWSEISDGNYITGYVSNFRVVKGTAVYTSTFTPPTSPLTAVTNTSLLTLQNRFGENNNRFVDTSGLTNLITRVGNATQGTFTPFSQTGWSNYFDGTGDSLSLANNVALNPGTSDFVMEAWVYITALTGANQGINGKGTAGTDGYSFFITNALVLSFIWNGTGGATITAGTLTLNTWNHIAVVRNSNVIRLYLNGVGAGSSTACTTDITSTATKFVGQARGANPMLGYMSNYRMIKGTLPSSYNATSSTITVPTTPLTAVANTSLLTCQSNRLRDVSSNNFTITRNGDVSVQSFSPFKTTAEWSANTVGGSMYFDGTGDYLTVPDNEAFEITGDFTVEAWFYSNYTPGAGEFANIITKGAAGVFQPYYIFINSSSNLVLYSSSNGSSWDVASGVSFGAVTLGQWYHVAVSRSGSSMRLFLNGNLVTTITNSSALTNNNRAVAIGARSDGTEDKFRGYISDVRLVKGNALYTAAFTPPTAPATPVAGTTLLLNGTNGGIIDYTSRNNLETVGDVKLRNDIVKYGNTSMYFDGSGDYLSIKPSPDLYLSTGDFTIEGWVYTTTATTTQLIFARRASATSRGFICTISGVSSQKLSFLAGNSDTTAWEVQLNSSTSLANNTWYHFAIVRSGNNFNLYINGVSESNATNSVTIADDTSTFFVGVNESAGNGLNGYLDDLRITKGYARYTSNFTPPTVAFKIK